MNHSAESALLDDAIETARIEKGLNVIQGASEAGYVNNLETQINLSSEMKELAQKSPDNSKLSNFGDRKSSNKDLWHTSKNLETPYKKKTVLQTIGTSGENAEAESSAVDIHGRSYAQMSHLGGQSERLNSKFLASLREGQQKINLIANPVLKQFAGDITFKGSDWHGQGQGKSLKTHSIPNEEYQNEFNSEP